MLRKRMISPEIWEDEHFGKLSDKAKVLFIACISNSDDEGRLSSNAANLRASAFRFEEIKLAQIETLLEEIARNMKNFQVYAVNGCKYIQFSKWGEHQIIRDDRKKSSKFPPCPQDYNQFATNPQPIDNQVRQNDRISKDKLSEVKLREGKESVAAEPQPDNVSLKALFEEIWGKYPVREGKKAARKHFESSVKCGNDWVDINLALGNYLRCEKVKEGFIKMGSTWFNNWRDWIDFKGVSRGKNRSGLTETQKAGADKEWEKQLAESLQRED